MRAAVFFGYGKEQKIAVTECPDPRPGDDDVLVKIRAASLNPLDFKIRDGLLKPLRRYEFPLIVGHDFAGTVIAVGRNVTEFRIGDEVFARPQTGRTGTLAEKIAVDWRDVARKPENMSFVEAAGLPLVSLTSWQALVERAGLKSGDTVFIPAGSGGVGTVAIQIAKFLGARVVTTTSPRNTEFVKTLGADRIIDYTKENSEDALRGERVDVVFDTLGGETLRSAFKIVRPGGWIVSIAHLPDHRTARDMGLGWGKTALLFLVGLPTNLRAWRAGVHYRYIFMRADGRQLAEIARRAELGKIRAIVDSEFPLAQAQAAMERVESGRARGKVIVRVADEA